MIVAAANRSAAVVLTEEEKFCLKDIICLSKDMAAVKRAKILIAVGEGKTIETVANECSAAKSVVAEVKRQWRRSNLSGNEKVNKICFAKAGRRRNEKAMAERVSYILKFNKRISPEVSQNARSLKIVEMAQEEGMQVSQSTVIRFLRDYREELNL